MSHRSSVCHIATMTQWGGVERTIIDFLTHADQMQLLHLMLATSSVAEVIAPIIQANIPTFTPTRRFHYDPAAMYQMAQWLKVQRIEIVHSYNAVGNAWGNLASIMAGVPVFISGEHGSVWRSRTFLYWLNRIAYRRANLVIANSQASQLMICRRYGVHPSKIRVVYNIVAPAESSSTQRARKEFGLTSEFVIGSIGRLVAQKGYSVLIKAAKEIVRVNPNVRFVVVGGGEQEAYLSEMVKEADLGDRFILTGWRRDARELLQAFDLFVSTSLSESFGNVLVEAGMAGIPVIAPRIDGIPEIVEDGVTGQLLYPSKSIQDKRSLPPRVVIDGELREPKALDPAELVDTILSYVRDPVLRAVHGEAGKKRAHTRFSMQRYLSEMDSIYSSLLQ